MAVYTEVRFDEADALFRRLGLGALTDLQGIRSGIENTNYYATTARGQWVLTLFERLSAEQLPYYLRLMEHLALQGIPVPAPQPDAEGGLVHRLAGKPASVVTRLPGSHRLAPDAAHCAQVGAMLARLHLAGGNFALHQPHLRGLAWWLETAPLVLPHLGAEQASLLRDELAFQQHLAASPAGQALPRGPIHADPAITITQSWVRDNPAVGLNCNAAQTFRAWSRTGPTREQIDDHQAVVPERRVERAVRLEPVDQREGIGFVVRKAENGSIGHDDELAIVGASDGTQGDGMHVAVR